MRERTQMRNLPNGTAVVQITTVGGRAFLRLKSWLPADITANRPVLLAGRELPSQVGATLPGPVHVLCVGPGEWLIVSHEHPVSSLRECIEPDRRKRYLVLVDLTDGFAGLDVQGSAAREIMSKGCGLDFHPRSFPAGRCARTRFAQIPVVIDCLDQPCRFELYVARSYVDYLRSWLTDAAVEFENAFT